MKSSETWDRVVADVAEHGRLVWPGEVWVERCVVDATRGGEIVMVRPYVLGRLGHGFPVVGEALLRSVLEQGNERAMADLINLLFKATLEHRRKTQESITTEVHSVREVGDGLS